MADIIHHFAWDVPPGKWAVKKKFVGTWRITELQGYSADYVNQCGPGTLKINARGAGQMNFGAVNAKIDCKMDDLDEGVLRFSFEGGDEGDPICGRGYCLMEGDRMIGRIFRHFSDEFGFKAEPLSKPKKPDQS